MRIEVKRIPPAASILATIFPTKAEIKCVRRLRLSPDNVAICDKATTSALVVKAGKDIARFTIPTGGKLEIGVVEKKPTTIKRKLLIVEYDITDMAWQDATNLINYKRMNSVREVTRRVKLR